MAERTILAIILMMALVSCGPRDARLKALDLQDCDGWTGQAPTTERALLEAAAAEKFGRLCANNKLRAVREIS